jgi:SLT domain-containing protein
VDIGVGIDQAIADIMLVSAAGKRVKDVIAGLFDSGTDKPKGGGKPKGHRAAGGPVSAGGTYLVGERGPELVTMGRSGHVTPNNRMGGGSVTINVNVAATADRVAIGRELVAAIQQYERRSGKVWRAA